MEMKKMKPMFGALACLFCILLLLVCVVIDTSSTSSSSQAVKMMEISENLLSTSSKERQVHRHHRLNTDLFRGSKRRVPNGPDPIHNSREVGKTAGESIKELEQRGGFDVWKKKKAEGRRGREE
ncbi:hypothetical protein DsansV1_C03g0032801 [Dioscorea sansibarensis]